MAAKEESSLLDRVGQGLDLLDKLTKIFVPVILTLIAAWTGLDISSETILVAIVLIFSLTTAIFWLGPEALRAKRTQNCWSKPVIALVVIVLIWVGISYFWVDRLLNTPPRVKRIVAEKYEVPLGQTIRLKVLAEDPDGPLDDLSYSWLQPTGARITPDELDSTIAIFEPLPPERMDRVNVKVVVQDSKGGSDNGSTDIQIVER